MARILIPSNARSYRPNELGAFSTVVTMAAKKNPAAVGLARVTKPAVAVRGSVDKNRYPITTQPVAKPPRGIIWRRPQDMPGATTGRVIPPGMNIWMPPRQPGYGFRSNTYPGIMGLGEAAVASPESTTLSSPTASADSSSFDWSKLATSLITAGGSIGASLIGARRPVAAPTTTVVQMPSASSSGSSGVSTQALLIGGSIAAGVLALVLILKK